MKKTHTVRAFLANVPSALLKLANAKIPAIPAVLAVVLVLGLVSGANAVNDKKQIAAYEDYTIAIKLDGEVQTPVNANGARVYPISYQGTTYLPIRAVAAMAGLQVDWDQANQTVLLSSKSADGVDLIDTYKAYYTKDFQQVQTADKKGTKDISGKSYSHWINMAIGQGQKSVGSFNVEGKYDTLTFTYYSNADVTLEVLGDNDYVLAEIPIKRGQVAQTIEVKLLGTSQLTFRHVETRGEGNELYIVDARLK